MPKRNFGCSRGGGEFGKSDRPFQSNASPACVGPENWVRDWQRVQEPQQNSGFFYHLFTKIKIQDDYGVQVFLSNGKRKPIPDGFAQLLIMGDKVDGVRKARAEIQKLLEQSLNINPNGVNHWKVDENGQIQELIRMPVPSMLRGEQFKRFTEIQQKAVNFY